MKRLFSSIAIVSCLTLSAAFSCASAARAVDFGISDDGEANSLQNQLNKITKGGPQIDTVKDQTGYEFFTNTATAGSSATFMFEIARMASTNKFGIYNKNLEKVQLFDGVNDISDGASIQFLADGSVKVFTNGNAPGNAGGFNFAEYKNFGNEFGFYIDTTKGVYYSQSNLNPNSSQQSVVYQGNNKTQLQIAGRAKGTFTDDEYIIAFEDLLRSIPGNSDSDFNDLVVMMESIEPARVPEPGTVSALAALGLYGVSLMLKKQGQQNKEQMN